MENAKLTILQWEEILQDKKILSPLALSIFQVLYSMPENKAPASKIGEVLGCGGYLSALCRTRIGNFDLKDAISVEEFVKSVQKL